MIKPAQSQNEHSAPGPEQVEVLELADLLQGGCFWEVLTLKTVPMPVALSICALKCWWWLFTRSDFKPNCMPTMGPLFQK